MWEKLIESLNGVQHFPCVQSEHGVFGGMGEAWVDSGAVVDKLARKSFGSSLKLATKTTI